MFGYSPNFIFKKTKDEISRVWTWDLFNMIIDFV